MGDKREMLVSVFHFICEKKTPADCVGKGEFFSLHSLVRLAIHLTNLGLAPPLSSHISPG